MVPTVERGLRLVVFCSMEMAGREAFDGVDVGALDLVEELAGVGGERFDVAALALGVDGVEGERTLAGAGETGDHRERVAGDAHVDVAQIVLARAAHRDVSDGHGRVTTDRQVLRCRAQETSSPTPAFGDSFSFGDKCHFGSRRRRPSWKNFGVRLPRTALPDCNAPEVFYLAIETRVNAAAFSERIARLVPDIIASGHADKKICKNVANLVQ